MDPLDRREEMPPAKAMRDAAAALLQRAARPGDERGARLRRPLPDPHRRWLEYRPEARPGVGLASRDPAASKAAHGVVATVPSPHASAQTEAVMAHEEVRRGREGEGQRR